MTPKQNRAYWQRWNKVRTLLTSAGEFSKEDAEAERHEIHRAALGKDKSSKELTNRDLDAIFDHFDKYLVLLDGPKSGPDRADVQPVKRLIYAIEQLGLPDRYLESISRDQFKTSDWRSLTERQLTRFRFTAVNRSRARKATEPPCDDPF
ncbi:hypothetical protein [Luteolibacter marinus]|uniref:hypothetical protein n=1 Tax=Luteolibacter marinus TaxID=2776705 RepID=UPI0018675413|nr:hypothetical protein [Luteolibacter marinus]